MANVHTDLSFLYVWKGNDTVLPRILDRLPFPESFEVQILYLIHERFDIILSGDAYQRTKFIRKRK